MPETQEDSLVQRGRFAPSTTGYAHPGTLLAGLLCWLDARAIGGEVILRLEDLDRERTKPGYVDRMMADFAWFGLEWDDCLRQSHSTERYAAALDQLAGDGRVYACGCSRAEIRRSGRRAPDGSFAYAGTCRANRVTASDWRTDMRPLRLHLEERRVHYLEEGGERVSGVPVASFGDPVIRRRDGAFAYHFVSVLDDAAVGVTRVIRGRDLAPSTLVQVALQRTLSLPTPLYRHHCLFLEQQGKKFSKFHGAVSTEVLKSHFSAEELCGLLASFVGLVPAGSVCRPESLVTGFDWSRVSEQDVALKWSIESGLERMSPTGSQG